MFYGLDERADTAHVREMIDAFRELATYIFSDDGLRRALIAPAKLASACD